MGFLPVFDGFKTLLETDADIIAFVSGKWNATLTVKQVFKKKPEIGNEEMPIVLITAPRTKKEQETGISHERKRIVRLYCGFKQHNKELGAREIIEFEEVLDKAILKSDSLLRSIPGVDSIEAGDEENDEGANHPDYFLVMEYSVLMEEVYG
ncbi:MAG: hypothetical protein AB1553_02040 [Nitrospirota bacterium]